MASPRQRRRSAPVRILTAVPLCDGHDSAIMTVNAELARRGAEVIYLGYHQPASAIARAAVQEDVDVIGVSSYNGGHLVFFRELLRELRSRGGGDIRVVGGGGGTITPDDARALRRHGVAEIFFAGTPLAAVVDSVLAPKRKRGPANSSTHGDRVLARAITAIEGGGRGPRPARPRLNGRARSPLVVGVAGPGGAGKSTLIDELTARYLRRPGTRVAVLANDPTHPDSGGAILGDRVSALYAQDDRVFFRSLATRGSLTGLSAAAPAAIELLRGSGRFDVIFVESVGIGQDSDPFGVFGAAGRRVDAVLFVLPPHYGGRIQLQKIPLLRAADFVVLNKCDDPRAAAAQIEIASRLRGGPEHQQFHRTVAAQHQDNGVNVLHAALLARASEDAEGGEKPCQLRVEV